MRNAWHWALSERPTASGVKSHRPGGLHIRNFLSQSWRLEVQVKVLAELIPSEGLFSLCAYMVILCPSLCPGFLLHGHHQMGSGSNHPSEGI